MNSELVCFSIDPEGEDESLIRLHQAAFQADYELLEKLLEETENLENINLRVRPFGATPLRLAATGGSLECVDLLLRHGADVNLPDLKQQTPLFVATLKQDGDCCRRLLEAGAHPDGSDGNLSTPLHIACRDGFTRGVQLLLKHGASVDCHNSGHPLRVTAAYKHLDCFVLLLLHGARCLSLEAVLERTQDQVFQQILEEFGGDYWSQDTVPNCVVCVKTPPRERSLTPLTLKALCRIQLHCSAISTAELHLPLSVRLYLAFRDIDAVDDVIQGLENIPVEV